MRNFFIVVAFIGLISNTNAQDTKKQSRKIGTFNTVTTTKGVNLTLIEGNSEKVEIEIENGDVTDVITDIEGRDLKVKLKTKIYKDLGVQVYLTYKSVNSINAETGSFITNEGTLRADNLNIKAGTGADIILDVDAHNIKASAISSKIELVGEVDFQEVSAVTGAKYIADKLVSREALVKAGTGGTAWVKATESLDMKTTTGGKIIYKGNPKNLKMKGNIQRDSE